MLYFKRFIFFLIFFFSFLYFLLFYSFTYLRVSAASSSDMVTYIDNRSDVCNSIIRAIIAHRSSITLSYPDIAVDFRKYRKNNYIDFFDRLSIDNGYYTGILSGTCISINDEADTVTFQLNYLTSKKQDRYIAKKARKIAGKFKGQSDYNKIKGAHDYIVKHTRYDDDYYNPYYVFRKGKGICMSYALAFQRIMQEMKIPCIYVKGNNHAWNMVKLEGRWYGVDVTWDDSNSSYTYFLKGTKDFYGHTLPKSKCIRKLKKARYSYK